MIHVSFVDGVIHLLSLLISIKEIKGRANKIEINYLQKFVNPIKIFEIHIKEAKGRFYFDKILL